jgi:signal transduction histidine kinase
MVQAFVNLLGNAIKFSRRGGRIEFAAERPPGSVLFRVKDEGRGIPKDKLERIFERFEQVDASDAREKGGTGLGLAICRSIVEQHGGRVWAESELGRGSTFYVQLPLAEADAIAAN